MAEALSDTTSDVVAILVAEVGTAIVAADKAVEMEREKRPARFSRCRQGPRFDGGRGLYV